MFRFLLWVLTIALISTAHALALPIQFTVSPLTPTSSGSYVYTQATVNNTDVVYLKTQSGLRTVMTDGSNSSYLGLSWPVDAAGLNNQGQFVYTKGASSDSLYLSTLATAPTATLLSSNPLYTGSVGSFLPDINDNGQIVFNNSGNQLWLTDTAGTFFTHLSSVIGVNPDGSSRVSINNNGKIVYSKNGDIFLTDILGSTPVNLTSSMTSSSGLVLSHPDINNNGLIVAQDSRAANREVWLFDIAGSAPVKVTSRTLNGEAGAPQINDLGQIVIPLDPIGDPDPSSWQVFLYTPVPEPASLLIVWLGFAWLSRKPVR